MKTKKSSIPKHIAIIMDGNRRWARARGLPDKQGHKVGVEKIEELVKTAEKLGVEAITIYALSTENITERAKREVADLFSIIRRTYNNQFKNMMKNGVKLSILGEIEGLPGAIRKIVSEIRDTYIKNESIKLNIALNYGGKKELISAIKELIEEGIEVDKLNEEIISKHLYTKGESDPDLVIRTGGRIRLSNFLLWQTAYSELYFTKVLWPDFDEKELKKAINWYGKQKRNFGK
ncbi:di-trans,poly-cis-decaprenylcistransferase [Candidatus Daviesbacteria bacterium]|nr:di-trans,poly-cis-decaprenylcistransferase [Candidatus Daviesbacteria bacterium]